METNKSITHDVVNEAMRITSKDVRDGLILPDLKPVKYENTMEHKKTIEYGTYLVVRNDGKKHLEIFNNTGWSHNNNSISHYYLPKIN